MLNQITTNHNPSVNIDKFNNYMYRNLFRITINMRHVYVISFNSFLFLKFFFLIFYFFLHTFFSIELPFSNYFNSTSETNFVVWFKGVLYFSKTKPYYLAQIRRCISFKGVLTFQIELLRLPDLPGKFLTAARPSPPLAPVTKLVHP